MTVQEVTHILEELAPLGQAEDFDNTGLLVGEPETAVTGILVTLDTLENVVDEALENGCNLIVSFHPIIFQGLKRITGAGYVERVVLKAIRHRIAIYSMHTALDNIPEGVNGKICERLGLTHPRILIPKKNSLNMLATYVPKNNAKALREALFEAGAGDIGRYSHCSFNMEGTGTYKAGIGAKPAKGTIGQLHYEEETKMSVVFPTAMRNKIIATLLQEHPYEEVAYEVYALENAHGHLGMGMIGELKDPMPATEFLKFVKERMNASCIRHSDLVDRPVKTVAVLGGSGAFAIEAAKAARADVLITSDIKYHEFFKAEGQMVIADIGHYESEQFTKNLLTEYLREKIPNFAIRLSESKTNPINYI